MSIEEPPKLVPAPLESGARSSGLHAFLDELLAEQQRLQTPVTRAAAAYSDAHLQPSAFNLQPFREAIPLSAPASGEQYAFEVDLDACSGCKACVAGCHSLNGLDEEETWRDVGLVLGADAAPPYQQTITSACHHCEDPGCMNGCPVLAYEKDPLTGIVRHLDDQCIGCSYCILKCPYDVPKFSKRLGIVRKCDMCHGRLAAGEAPACVQACPTHAIRITRVPTSRPADLTSQFSNFKSGPSNPTFLPVFPDPSYTRPTTRYVSKRPLPENLRAADASILRVQPLHAPLVIMLVLTQASVGALLAHALAGATHALTFAVVCGVAGIAASVAHLGQPLRAWRVFLGLRRSWLSREAVLFGAYLPALAAAFAVPHLPSDPMLPPRVAWAAAALGVASVLCSIMIYADTRRRFWRFDRSALRMGGTVAVVALGFASPVAAAFALGLKVALESLSLRGMSVSARLQRGPLRRLTRARFAFGIAGVALFPIDAPLALALALAGELAERALYFRAVDAPKMPGVPN